jgi:hypothetical protein
VEDLYSGRSNRITNPTIGGNFKMMNKELAHFGILGMKWGVRRTDAQLSNARKMTKDNPIKIDNVQERKKSVKDMSDDELKKAVNRLQMEEQYTKLSKNNINSGKKYVSKVIKAGTTVAAVTTTALTLYNNANKIKEILTKFKG